MRLTLLLFVFCGISYVTFAQEDAWVYFTNKENVESALQNPITILSQQALNRKSAHNIPIDERDVPVNESYISQLKAVNGIEVLSKSKWMNAVHVRGEAPDITSLQNFGFVQTIDFADRNLNVALRPSVHNRKFEVEDQLEDFNYGKATNQVEMIHVDALHREGFTGEGVVVAVIDAGFPNVNTMSAFQRLRDQNGLLGGYDFVERSSDIYTGNAHGTKVLSTMAGYIENEFVGTAPGASYYLFRTENELVENPVEESLWVEAVERADSLGVHIINSSLGYNTFDDSRYDYLPSDMDGKTAFITRGANFAVQKGLLVVNSAGNSGSDSWGIVTAPGDAPGVLTVGAVNPKGVYAYFSSLGSDIQPTQKPDVVAQGYGSMVIDVNDAVINNSGTSFSSPIMAGAIACLWQALPNASVDELKQSLILSASQYSEPDYKLGYGIPNFELALSQALSMDVVEERGFKVFPNPASQKLYIQSKIDVGGRTLHIYDMMGKLIWQQNDVNESSNVDVSHLTSGVYFLKIMSATTSYNFKFIKS